MYAMKPGISQDKKEGEEGGHDVDSQASLLPSAQSCCSTDRYPLE